MPLPGKRRPVGTRRLSFLCRANFGGSRLLRSPPQHRDRRRPSSIPFRSPPRSATRRVSYAGGGPSYRVARLSVMRSTSVGGTSSGAIAASGIVSQKLTDVGAAQHFHHPRTKPRCGRRRSRRCSVQVPAPWLLHGTETCRGGKHGKCEHDDMTRAHLEQQSRHSGIQCTDDVGT